jgi:hypothetical protein
MKGLKSSWTPQNSSEGTKVNAVLRFAMLHLCVHCTKKDQLVRSSLSYEICTELT